MSFMTKMKETINKHIPHYTAKKRSHLPWMNRPLLKLLRRKKKIYNRAKETKNWSHYKKFQKHCQRETRRAEWKFINNTIQIGLENNNPKPFWNLIKSRKCDNTGVSPLRQNGKLLIEPVDKAKVLLNQFKSVFTQDDGSFVAPPTNQTLMTFYGWYTNLNRRFDILVTL